MAIENNDDRLQEWLDATIHENNQLSGSKQPAGEAAYRKLYHLLKNDDTSPLPPEFNAKLLQRIENHQLARSFWGWVAGIGAGIIVVIAFIAFTGGLPLLSQWQGHLISWFAPILGSFNYDYVRIFREAFSGINISFSYLLLAGLAIFVVFLFDELFFQKKKNIHHSVNLLCL